MRVAFIHSSKDKRVANLARYMVGIFEKEGWTVKLLKQKIPPLRLVCALLI